MNVDYEVKVGDFTHTMRFCNLNNFQIILNNEQKFKVKKSWVRQFESKSGFEFESFKILYWLSLVSYLYTSIGMCFEL